VGYALTRLTHPIWLRREPWALRDLESASSNRIRVEGNIAGLSIARRRV
jgi:hypothetical protein